MIKLWCTLSIPITQAAFVPNTQWTKPPTTTLFNVKKTGGGLAPKPAGNLSIFDPEKEGRLQGTGSVNERIQNGPNYSYTSPPPSSSFIEEVTMVSSPPDGVSMLDAQNWLEDLGVPLNFAKPTKPVMGSILGSSRIIAEDAPGDIRHIIIKVPEGLHYVEGQSISGNLLTNE